MEVYVEPVTANDAAEQAAKAEQAKNEKIGGYFMAVLGLLAVGYFAKKVMAPSDSGNAYALIQEGLRSPSSFSAVSSDTVWEGHDAKSNAARIVRVDYDAQNGFGATVRECQYVAFWYEGSKVFHFPNRHRWSCGSDSQEIVIRALIGANNFQS